METNQEEQLVPEPFWKGPLRMIGALFLIFLVVVWIIPSYVIKTNPEPQYIPTIAEVIPSGNGNETVPKPISSSAEMRSLLHPQDPFIKRTADKIITLSGCQTDKVCQAKAFYYFVRDRFTYVEDPAAFEYIKSAQESLQSQGGDCDDASVLLANVLEAVGIETRFVFIPGHVFVQAWLPDAPRTIRAEQNWVNLDATCRYCKAGEVPYATEGKQKQYLA